MNDYWVKAGSTMTLTGVDPDDAGDYKKTDQGKDHDCFFLPQPLRCCSSLSVGMFYA